MMELLEKNEIDVALTVTGLFFIFLTFKQQAVILKYVIGQMHSYQIKPEQPIKNLFYVELMLNLPYYGLFVVGVSTGLFQIVTIQFDC